MDYDFGLYKTTNDPDLWKIVRDNQFNLLKKLLVKQVYSCDHYVNPITVVLKKIDLIRLCLLFNANVNLPDKHGLTPLHKAAAIGDQYIVKLLLEKGADKNIKDNYGRTPQFYANYYQQENVMQYFQ